MNNKGFTLVELLAVMVILAAISLIVVGGISASLDKRYEKEEKEQIELAIGAAKIYFSLNEVKCVTVQDLIKDKYFSNKRKVDRLKVGNTIKLVGNKYIYDSSGC